MPHIVGQACGGTTHRRTRNHVLLALGATIVVCLQLMGLPSAHAQSANDDTTERADQSLSAPSVPAQQLDRHWRVWRRQLEEDQSGTGSLETLAVDSVSVGRPNPRLHVMAALHMLGPGGGTRLESNSLRRTTYETLAEIAPDLPYPRLGHAWTTIRVAPLSIGESLTAYADGLSRSVRWLDTRVSWGGRFATALLIALLALCFVGLAASLLRHLPIAGYDLARGLPRGITATQMGVALLLVIATAAVATGSVIVGVSALFIVVSWTQRLIERLPGLVFAALLIVAPSIAPLLNAATTYADSPAQRAHHAMYVGCDDACRKELQSTSSGDPRLDATLDYATALSLVRRGETGALKHAMSLLRELEDSTNRADDWSEALNPWRTQLIGVIHAARGEFDSAVKAFEDAATRLPDSFAAHFNLMKTHRRIGNETAAAKAHDLTAAIDEHRLDKRESLGAYDVNTQLVPPPLPNDLIWRAHTAAVLPMSDGLWSQTWSLLHGEGSNSRMWGIGLAIALLLTWGGRWFQIASRPCPNCAGPKEPRDIKRTDGHAYCHPCYRAFISSGSLHHRRRVRVEQTLRRRGNRRSTTQRAGSAVAPGFGHFLAGYSGRGAFISGATAFGIALLFELSLVGPPPAALFGTDWLGWTWIAVATAGPAVIVALWTAARGIEPYERSP